ncbi:MAG: hypothetical protein ACK4L8_16805, partial [Nitrincola lacisaponensis]|uniref:hypothetical protein n=1 Tax=Nitrincola lacisaponensis TaxID=267850 RepID=UPI003918B6D8
PMLSAGLALNWGETIPGTGLIGSSGGSASGGLRWKRGTPGQAIKSLPFGLIPAKRPITDVRWQDGDTKNGEPRMTAQKFRRLDDGVLIPWDTFSDTDRHSGQQYSHPDWKDRGLQFKWADFQEWADGYNWQRYSHPPPKDEHKLIPYWRVQFWMTKHPIWETRDYTPPPGNAVNFDFTESGYDPDPLALDFAWGAPSPYGDQPIMPTDSISGVPHKAPTENDQYNRVKWGNGRWERPLPDYIGGGGWTAEPDTDPAPRPPQPIISEVYIIMPNITLWRIPDGAEIEATNVRWYTDADTWAWSLTATISDPAHLEIIKPNSNGPGELGCEINGHLFTALVEGYTKSRQFGQTVFTIQGRSRTAWLSDPYAPRRSALVTAPYSARQLAEQELQNTGYTLDWHGPDWQIPGDAYTYHYLDPIAAIKRIAEARGAILQSHPDAKKLIVKPRYPVDPHKWTQASTQLDAILPEDMIIQSGSEYRTQPKYNRAIVTGGAVGGVIVTVTRDGTAGDILAPIQQHDLITDQVAGYERGRNEIAQGGVWETIRATTWLTPDNAPGLILPGQLVEIQPDTGTAYPVLIGSTEITAASTEAEISVRQILGMERKIDH